MPSNGPVDPSAPGGQKPAPSGGRKGPAVVSPLLPIDPKYPDALFNIDGPLLRLASDPSTGLSLNPQSQQIVPNQVTMSNINDRFRRTDPQPTSYPPPAIDIPVNTSMLPIRREYQQCQYVPNPAGHK